MTDIIDELEIFPQLEGTCPECASRHEPGQPHNRNSLYYQVTYFRRTGALPTWANAMAHCTDAVKKEWTAKLKEAGIPIGMDRVEPSAAGEE